MLIAAAARCLEEAGGDHPDRETAGQDGPRTLPAEVLDVLQHSIGPVVPQIGANLLGLLCGPIGELGGRVLSLFAELLTDRTQILRRGGHPLAGLRRALVQLPAQSLLCFICGFARLFLRSARDLLGLFLGFANASVSHL